MENIDKLIWDEFWWEIQSYVPLFKMQLKIIIDPWSDEKVYPSPQQLTIYNNIDNLPGELINKLDNAAYKYSKSIGEENLDAMNLSNINLDNIKEYYTISHIHIPWLGNSEKECLFLVGACAWEPEHGLECLVDNQVIMYMKEFNATYHSEEWVNYLNA